MPNLILVPPIDGCSSPLQAGPDPAVAGKPVADGLPVHPTRPAAGAPCDGEVVPIAAARHAVVLRSSNGAEILLHVGCDTAGLGGEGFEAHASIGQIVRTGDPLLSFDLDAVAS